MDWGPAQWILELLGRGDSGDYDDSTRSDGGSSSALFECSECDTTYISEEMESCPSCGAPVESVPNESDLDLG